MRVLLVANHFNIGGIASYVSTLAKRLSERNHYVCVASSGGSLESRLQAYGIPHVQVRVKTKSEVSLTAFAAVPILRRLMREQKIDIVHSHTRVTDVVASIARLGLPVEHVETFHGFYKRRLGRRLFPCIGSAVIAISPPVQEHLIVDHHVPAEKIVLIPNGIDEQRFIPVAAQDRLRIRRSLGLPDGKIIGMVSRFSRIKGHHVAIEALPQILRSVPDAHLVFVGDGVKRGEVEDLVAAKGLTDRIHCLGQGVWTHEFYAAVDCYIMPSLQEGLGLALMEAQSAGAPVVGSRTGGILSLIKDGVTGLLVTPGDPLDLARAVVRVLQDPVFAAELGREARRFIEREGTATRMTEQILAVYERVLAERRS